MPSTAVDTANHKSRINLRYIGLYTFHMNLLKYETTTKLFEASVS
jgi:hypothetical protein